MATAFFPLDNELGLLAKKRYTPRIQESMARLGAKLPFAQAADEVQFSHAVQVGPSTVRETTHEMGQALVAINAKQAEQIKETRPEVTKEADVLQLSADGCFIHTTSGEWREVKTLAIGVVKPEKGKATTGDWSYFSRCATARKFEDAALVEIQQRAVEKADVVVAVNDGATWLQSFTDYHRPDAVRILDFAHAAGYLATAGKAVLGEGSNQYRGWYAAACDRLCAQPPEQTLARLYLLARQAPDKSTEETVFASIDYLERRAAQIDYAHFLRQPYPIGSGSVESANKHVVQQRMKQSGMRWAEHCIDSMLAARNLIANDRWPSGWLATVEHRLAKQHDRQDIVITQAPAPAPVVTIDSVAVLPEDTQELAPPTNKPTDDHPWKRGIWPDPR